MCQCDFNASDSSRYENTHAIAVSITVHQFDLLPFYLPRYMT